MIKKIICPIDFSDTAINAVEYAGKLAQVFNAELSLLHVERLLPIAAAMNLGEGMDENIRENSLLASQQLKEMSIEANRVFKISVSHEVNVTTRSLARTLSSSVKKNTMIVMGTNGADNLSQFFFGTNTYHVIQKTKCPVLLVPEGYSFGTYRKILYAFTYEEKGRLALNQFCTFIKSFDARFTFLHVSKKDTAISRDVFRAMKEEAEEYFDSRKKIEFKQIFSNDVSEAIEEFIQNEPTDLLVMAARHRGVIENIFKKRPLLLRLSAITPYPILVFHS